MSDDDDRWEFVHQSHSPLPYTIAAAEHPPSQTLRKNPSPAVGILRALKPPNYDPRPADARSSQERSPETIDLYRPDKDTTGSFWVQDKDIEREIRKPERETERGTERERRDKDNELTRKIGVSSLLSLNLYRSYVGFLTATASEDWTLVLDVCDQASANESNAKEAVRALRRDLKYGEAAAQLAAARVRVLFGGKQIPANTMHSSGQSCCAMVQTPSFRSAPPASFSTPLRTS